LAARERLGVRVTGFDPTDGVLGAARDRGAVDVACASVREAVAAADTAVVAAPVGALPAAVAEVLAAAPPDCVVTDVGSTKRAVVASTQDERFVGGHPLAGAETKGVEHARADLFEGATWYLTPTSRTGGILLERLHRVIAGFGARPRSIGADEHDRMLAAISHLPHVLANVLVKEADGAIGPSFRDATRVAGANPPLWRDIYLANRTELSRAIGAIRAELAAVDRALLEGDGEWLEDWQGFAADRRRELLEAEGAGGALAEVRLVVPNRPGVVAELALALGREGINIHDMSLSPSADNTRGEIAFWVPEAEARRAAEVVGA